MAAGEKRMAQELRRILSEEKVLAGPAVARAYDCDAYPVEKSAPSVVVLPESTEQVQAVVRWCLQNEIPFTPRGAGTGLSGGAMPALGGVVISTKRMTRILEIDAPNRRMKAQAGAVNKRLSEAVAAENLHFAPDPSSQTVSTLGGNIAENSGGPHTLKYGVTAQHVLAVTMIDPQGEAVELGSLIEDAPGFDFVGLIVGAEGTLGIVTEAWIKLTPNPAAVETALAAFPTVSGATRTVADLIASGTVPSALEIMDHGILRALNAAFGLSYPEGAAALLLIECDGEAERVAEELAVVREVCGRHGALNLQIAQNEAERQSLWTARKKGIGAMGRIAPTIVTHDGVIPRSKLPEMLDFCYVVAEEYQLGLANIFHAGDGNLHPCFYFDDREPGAIDRVVEAGEKVLKRCIELGGSVTGEHGIGVEKLDLMSEMFSPEDLRLQGDFKRVFNEGALCNPCKVLPNQKSCVEHRTRWRGAAW